MANPSRTCKHCGAKFDWVAIHFYWCSWDCYDMDESPITNFEEWDQA